jgi:uncharacterized protein YkwD
MSEEEEEYLHLSEEDRLDVCLGVLDEINRVRHNPQKYADEMEEELSNAFDESETNMSLPDGTVVETLEGELALRDCLKDLRQIQPLPALVFSEQVSRCCETHRKDLELNDFFSHLGTDGSTPESRLSREGEYREQCGENLGFALRTPKELIYSMLIDDGSSERGHRSNILNMDFHYLGVAFGPHPSAEHAFVLVFVDSFSAKSQGAIDRVRKVTGMPDNTQVENPWHPVVKKWVQISDGVLPAYLSVSTKQGASVHRLHKPAAALPPAAKGHLKPTLVGSTVPVSDINPAMVKGFVHKMDQDHDDRISEAEVLHINYLANLLLSDKDVTDMFDEILSYRPSTFRGIRGITWQEIYAAIQVQKMWVWGVTISIETASDTWHILRTHKELCDFGDALYAKCRFMAEENGQQMPDLPNPSLWRTSKNAPNGVKRVNKFFQKLIFACDEDRIPASEPLLQDFVRDPADTSGLSKRHLKIVVSGLRQVWAYPRRPYRTQWLKVLQAAEKDPIIRRPKSKGSTRPEAKKAATKDSTAKSTRKEGATVMKKDTPATTGGKYCGLPSHMLGCTIRELSSTLVVRSERPTDLYPANGNSFDIQNERIEREVKGISAEVRTNATNLVNSVINKGDNNRFCSFAAKSLFEGIQQKIERGSNERRVLSTLKSGGASSMPNLFSTSPLEVRSIFHNGCNETVDYPSKPPVPKWEGSHIDHTKLPYVHEDYKIAYMSPEERAGLWNTNFHTPDLQAKKIEVLDHRRDILGPYKPFQMYEAREDLPLREGMYGRRYFDPVVKSRPLENVGGISEIESKPMEEYWRSQEKMKEQMERTLPPSQKRHFDPSRKKSEMPLKHQTVGLKIPQHDTLWGERDSRKQDSMLGWGQTRANHYPTDYKTYARPLGSSDLDRRVAIGPPPQ